MTMQAWRRLYELWRQYGLSKAAFYQFIDGEMPSLWCMYDRFHRIQLEIEAEQAAAEQAPVSVAESRTVAVVTLPAEDGEPRRGRRNGRGRESSVDSFLRHRQPRDVRLVLPGGTRLEFTSESPELLAMAMLQSAGGPT